MRPFFERQCEVTPERIANLNQYQKLTINFCKQLCIKVAKTSIETRNHKRLVFTSETTGWEFS